MSARKIRRVVIGAATATVLVVLTLSVLLMESPGAARQRRFDERRASDLWAIQAGIDLYWEAHDRLPPSMEAACKERKIQGDTLDPVSRQPYEYNVIDSVTYELCASFDLESPLPGPGRLNFSYHSAGRDCFKHEVHRRESVP